MDVKVGKVIAPLYLEDLGNSWKMTSPNKAVREHVIKGMQDRKWHGGRPPNWDRDHMYYTCPKTSRNYFSLNFYRVDAENPYLLYSLPLADFGLAPRYSQRKGEVVAPFPHQKAMADHWWTRRRCHIAAEMRTGKSLPTLSVAERLQKYTWIVAPRSAIAGLKIEMRNWDIQLDPVFMTYEELTKHMKTGGMSLPEVVIFDECSKIKTWSAQRTQAAFHLTECMRQEFDDPYIVAMSGTPAPKNPTDIWAQIEIICPGYIKESNPKLLEQRLSLIEFRDSETGGQYPHRIRWFDEEGICRECGEKEHVIDPSNPYSGHPFNPAKNEVRLFGERLKGISILFLKKDCLNLPDKEMEVRKLKPHPKVLMYAKQIRSSAASPATMLNDLLQLSGGFFYKMKPHETDKVICTMCEGEKVDPEGEVCTRCEGTGLSPRMLRKTVEIECPKEDEMVRILEECEESARFVGFGSFQGAIDRMCSIAEREGWNVIRVDGRGWSSKYGSDTEALEAFNSSDDEKIAFIAHPASGGMGFSLSRSSTIMYWSNGYNNDDRMQSIERASDLNMDPLKGCRIIDLVQLNIDQLVLDNLEKKRNLQEITLNELKEAIDEP